MNRIGKVIENVVGIFLITISITAFTLFVIVGTVIDKTHAMFTGKVDAEDDPSWGE